MNISEQIAEIAGICEAITEIAGKPYTLKGERVSPGEWRKFMKEREGIKRQNATKAKYSRDTISKIINGIKKWKDTAKGVTSIHCGYVSEGRNLRDISDELYSKMQSMKHVNSDDYDLPAETKQKVSKTLQQQQGYKDLLANAQGEGDKAKENILAGQVKRTENRVRALTKEERAKIYKSMGKRIQALINRDPSRVKKKGKSNKYGY